MDDFIKGGPVYSRSQDYAKKENRSVKTRFGALPAGKEVDFMAAKNEFTSTDNADPNADKDNLYGKDGAGKGDGCYSAPAPTSK